MVVQGSNEYQNTAAEFYDYFELGQPGDTRFYVEEVKKSASPALELGCGTGANLLFALVDRLTSNKISLPIAVVDLDKNSYRFLSCGVGNCNFPQAAIS